jgi:hypothetical protein
MSGAFATDTKNVSRSYIECIGTDFLPGAIRA